MRLDVTQVYARFNDETRYHQFQDAMSRLETRTLQLRLMETKLESVPIFADKKEAG